MLISIIIPTYNNCSRLELCLQEVLEQVKGRCDIEVIVVDNGSNDKTHLLLKNMGVKTITEDAWQSPYLCRNVGIKESLGKYIILLDSNCIPIGRWLDTCESVFKKQFCGFKRVICSGQIVFETTNDRNSRLSRFDVLYSLGDKMIEEDIKAMPGGHLLFERLTYDYVGPFLSNVRSLGDIEWTSRAHQMGVKLKKVKELRVKYPPKTGLGVLKKMYRLGRGKKEIWAAQNRSFSQIDWLVNVIKKILPPSPSFVQRFILYNRQYGQGLYVFEIIAYCWIVKIMRGTGMLFGKIIHQNEVK